MGRVAVTVRGQQVTADYELEPPPFYDSLTDPLSRWTLENGQAKNTASYDKASNVTKDSAGAILIRGAREAAPNGAAFTSGDAKGMHIPLYDAWVAEVDATNPYGPGVWPCPFWTRRHDGGAGEIDLMEQFGVVPTIKTTIHGPYGTPHPMVGRTRRWDTLPNPDPAGRHLWRLEKTRTSVKTYVDGLPIGTITREQAMAAGIDWDDIYASGRRHYPRVTLQLGCGTDNPGCASGQPAAAFTTCVMKIHRIRIWA